MGVLFLFLVMSFLNLTPAEFFGGNADDVDVVDPTGWDYDRVTKGSRRYDCIIDPSGWNDDRLLGCSQRTNDENDKDNLTCENLLSKCKADIAYFQLKTVAAIPADPNSHSNFSSQDANNSSSVFIKRFVNLLLDSASLLDDEKSTSGDIEIVISPIQLKMLMDYSSSRIDISLRELDSILTNIIHKKPFVTNSFSWKDVVYSIIVQKEVWLYLSILCIVLTFCRVVLTVRTVSGVAKLALFALFVVSYLIEYFKMYKAVEIRQRAYLQRYPDTPDACNPQKQSMWFNLFEGCFSFKKDECEAYYKELWAEPFMEVSPLCVLSSIMTDFILHPTTKIGKAIVAFSSVILGELPIQYGWFIYLMSSFGILVTVILTFIILAGGSVRLGGLFGGLEISQNRRPIASAPSNNQPEHMAIKSAPASTDDQSLPRKTSASTTHVLLEAVGKTDSFVLMDTTSLQNILKGSLIQHRREIEELSVGPDTKPALPEPKSKEKTTNGSSCSEGPRIPLNSDSSSNLDSECNLIDFSDEAGGGLNPDKYSVKSSSASSDDLFPTCNTTKLITSEVEDFFELPICDKKEVTAVA